MRAAWLSFLCLSTAAAQPVIAPTNAQLGTARGENIGAYNIVNSFETGYRFRQVGGNLGKYRSDVNFGNGVRLLGSNLTINSREGHGGYFDELLLNTVGLGNDPYQMATLRVAKNSAYRYDLLWRQNDYYNPALPIANGQHLINTTRALQDHSLVLLPQSKLRLLLGYSRNSQAGPALSTVQVFDSRGDEFPLFTDVRRLQNEVRIGAEAQVAGFRLSLLRSWEFFKDDTERRITEPSAGNNGADPISLSSFRRTEPYHGSTRHWRVHLLSEKSKFYSVTGRFTYSGGQRDFIFDESAVGTDRFGGTVNRQILLFGNARRPVTTASTTVSIFPSSKLTITNHTAFHHTRMDGDGNYRELDNTSFSFSLLQFQFLGIRTISNTTDANYRFSDRIGIFGGYQFSTRRIRSIEQVDPGGFPDRIEAEQDNTLQAGRFGLRLRPIKPLSIVVDAEVGRNDRPFYPTSERNYQVFGGRIQYRTRALSFSALARTNYNTNSVSLANHSSRSRNYSLDASWSPLTWFGFDASYSKLHIDTVSAIAYFFNSQLVQNDRAVYGSNIHSGTLGSRFGVGKRTDLFIGYSRIQDTGSSLAPVVGSLIGFQSYPLAFDSPFARVSVRLHNKLRWNAGYQHYRYAEDLLSTQNYRAHTGFTSLSWAF